MTRILTALCGLPLCLTCATASAADPSPRTQSPAAVASESDSASEAKPGQPLELVPLNPNKTVLLDRDRKRLVLKTEVVLRAGLLEMLLCKKQTKEHESILSIDSEARIIHAGLMAIGAEPGTPVRYEPTFQPPTGQKIRVVLNWTDAEGKPRREEAQRWVRRATQRYYGYRMKELPAGFTLPKEGELRFDEINGELLWFGRMSEEQRDALLKLSDDDSYQKAIRLFFDESQPRQLEADWVFAGSGFYELQDGSRRYMAEDGNLICVANFGDAMLDLSIESSPSNEGLLFEPYTERIPELGTEVMVELIPVPKAESERRLPENGDPGAGEQPEKSDRPSPPAADDASDSAAR